MAELPPVDDLAITYDPTTNTVTLTCDWNHLIPVTGFAIYRYSNPDVPIDSYHILDVVPGTEQQFTEPAYGPKYFYRVTA